MMKIEGSTMTIKLDKKMFNIDQASGLTKKQKAAYKHIVKDDGDGFPNFYFFYEKYQQA